MFYLFVSYVLPQSEYKNSVYTVAFEAKQFFSNNSAKSYSYTFNGETCSAFVDHLSKHPYVAHAQDALKKVFPNVEAEVLGLPYYSNKPLKGEDVWRYVTIKGVILNRNKQKESEVA